MNVATHVKPADTISEVLNSKNFLNNQLLCSLCMDI